MSRPSLALLLALIAGLCAATPAAAGTYQVYSCRTPANVLAPTDGWEGVVGHTTGFVNGCSGVDGNLALHTQSRHEDPGAYEAAHVAAPADTVFSKLTVWRHAAVDQLNSDGVSFWSAWLGFGSPAASSAFELCGAGCSSKGERAASSVVNGNRLDVMPPSGARELFVAAGCVGAGSGCNTGAIANTPRGYAQYDVQAVQAELQDDIAPVVAQPVGSMANEGRHKGVVSLAFSASDKGGGLYHTLVETKATGGDWAPSVRQVVDANSGRCQELDYLTDTDREFGFRVPCVLSASETVDFDTAALADGTYQLRVRVEDAAGNVATVLPERAFEIDNVPAPSVSGGPSISGTARLGAPALTGMRGTWTGANTQYAYSWSRCASRDAMSCTSIGGATADSYRLATDDLGRWVRFGVTATNAEGSTTATSDFYGPVTDANGAVPACADGTDNDDDGKIDTDDPQCGSRAGTSEGSATSPIGPTTTDGGTGGGGTDGGGASGGGTANGANASSQARLTLSGPPSRTIGFRRSGQTRVTLRDENGRAISGATIQVLQRMSVPGQSFVPAHSPVTTDADGTVRYLIEPGASRTLRFAYAPTIGGEATIVRDLKVTVPSRTTLRTDKTFLLNGQTLHFLGRVLSTPVPTAGVVIDLQAKVGRRWQTFNSIRTNSAGRWHASYRFRSTSGLQTYTFRARVRGDTGLPYAPSRSKTVKVRVKG